MYLFCVGTYLCMCVCAFEWLSVYACMSLYVNLLLFIPPTHHSLHFYLRANLFVLIFLQQNIDNSKIPLIIEMYKKYKVLWQVNDVAFGLASKRNEAFANILEELKSIDDFDMNLGELQQHIDYLNYMFAKDKAQQLKCEMDKVEFKPAMKFYKSLSFLGESQGPFRCPNCQEIVAKYDRYRIHVAKHNNIIPFPCRLCEMGFHNYDSYLLHVRRHLGLNSYHCTVCGKGYPLKSELDWHSTLHTGVKPFLCPICGNGFRTRHNYDNHVRRHEKRFRFECQICKHGFNHPGNYKSHVKTHLNIRDIICEICGKGFTGKKYLQRHKIKHDEEKRFRCSVCDRAFATDRGFKLHQKLH